MTTETKEEMKRYGQEQTCLVRLDGSWLQLDSYTRAATIREMLNAHLDQLAQLTRERDALREALEDLLRQTPNRDELGHTINKYEIEAARAALAMGKEK